MDECDKEYTEHEYYFSSDDEVWFGPYTIREAKRDIKRMTGRQIQRRHTVDCSLSSNTTNMDENSLIKHEGYEIDEENEKIPQHEHSEESKYANESLQQKSFLSCESRSDYQECIKKSHCETSQYDSSFKSILNIDDLTTNLVIMSETNKTSDLSGFLSCEKDLSQTNVSELSVIELQDSDFSKSSQIDEFFKSESKMINSNLEQKDSEDNFLSSESKEKEFSYPSHPPTLAYEHDFDQTNKKEANKLHLQPEHIETSQLKEVFKNSAEMNKSNLEQSGSEDNLLSLGSRQKEFTCPSHPPTLSYENDLDQKNMKEMKELLCLHKYSDVYKPNEFKEFFKNGSEMSKRSTNLEQKGYENDSLSSENQERGFTSTYSATQSPDPHRKQIFRYATEAKESTGECQKQPRKPNLFSFSDHNESMSSCTDSSNQFHCKVELVDSLEQRNLNNSFDFNDTLDDINRFLEQEVERTPQEPLQARMSKSIDTYKHKFDHSAKKVKSQASSIPAKIHKEKKPCTTTGSKYIKKLFTDENEKPKYETFKIPTKTLKQQTPQMTKMSSNQAAYKDLVSPVGIYIHKSPRYGTIRNPSHIPVASSLPKETKEHFPTQNIPSVIYKPGRQIVLAKEEKKLPESIKKLVIEPKITSHKERKIVRNIPLDTSANMTLNSGSFLSDSAKDISLVVKKIGFTKN